MQTITKKFYCDPGHGWMAVKRQELFELGIATRVSQYSYQNGKTVYLEEDCDASLYIQAMREIKGIEVEPIFKHSDKNSPIRSYQRFCS